MKVLFKVALTSLMLISSSYKAENVMNTEPYVFKGPKGVEINAEIGSFQVPENRNKAGSRLLTLKYVRFPAETANPAAPVVYLSGGPGGSATGTAKGPRFPLFMEMRKTADVILFDQRGTGLSDQLEDCTPDISIDFSKPKTMESILEFYKSGINYCKPIWEKKGYDLNGYNTKESAADLEDLRKHLNAEKLNIWAISYGTHLALATAKYFPETLGQMVLASSEGLNHTIKSPARLDTLLKRVDALIAKDPSARAKYPDLTALMKRVHKKLESNPVVVDVKNRQGGVDKVAISKVDVQMLSSYVLLKNPDMTAKLPAFYKAIDMGQYQMAGQYVSMLNRYMGGFNPMQLAMDSASGVTDERFQKVLAEAETSTLGRIANYPFPDVNQWLGVKDLGDEFRKEVESDIPTLFLAGNLDGRTLIESQKDLSKGFKNGHFITVDGAGHDLFVTSPEIIKIMRNFYEGKKVTTTRVDVGQPKFM